MAQRSETDQTQVIERERVNPDTGEVLVTKDIVRHAEGVTGVNIGGKAYNVTRRVNVPTLKHDSGEVVAFRIDAPIREEVSLREVPLAGGQKGQEEVRINVVRVTEAGSGQEFEYVCNAMTADNLRSAYPEHGYVGRSFAVQKLGVVAGKRYKETNVIEIEPAG